MAQRKTREYMVLVREVQTSTCWISVEAKSREEAKRLAITDLDAREIFDRDADSEHDRDVVDIETAEEHARGAGENSDHPECDVPGPKGLYCEKKRRHRGLHGAGPPPKPGKPNIRETEWP